MNGATRLNATHQWLLGIVILLLPMSAGRAQTCVPLQDDGTTPCITAVKWNEVFRVSGEYIRVQFKNDCGRSITVDLVREDGPDIAVVPKEGTGGSHCAKSACGKFLSFAARCTSADRKRRDPSPSPAPPVTATSPGLPTSTKGSNPVAEPARPVTHPRPTSTSVEHCRNTLHELPFPTVYDCSSKRMGPEDPSLRRQWQVLCGQQDDDVTRYCEMKRDGVNAQAVVDRAKARWKEMDRLLSADSRPRAEHPTSAPTPSARPSTRYSIPSDLRTNCRNQGLYLVRGTRAHNVTCVSPPERAQSFCESSLHGRYVTENGDRLCLDQ